MCDMPERIVAILIAWVSWMLYNQEDFDPKVKRFNEDLYPSVLEYAAQPSSNQFYSA